MTVLCHIDELRATGARGPFPVLWQGEMRQAFVVMQRDQVRAYINWCPHVGAPLEMEADRYLDLSGNYIVCTMHGAWFDILTGQCVLGLCKGKGLTTLPIRVVDGVVQIS